MIGQVRLLSHCLWLIIEVLNLNIVLTNFVSLIQSLLLLLPGILFILSCFATLAKELSRHGLGAYHLLFAWLLIAALVFVFVLDATLNAQLLGHAVVNDAAWIYLLILDLSRSVVHIKHFLVERLLEKLIIVVRVEVVVEWSCLVLVMN